MGYTMIQLKSWVWKVKILEDPNLDGQCIAALSLPIAEVEL